MDKTFHLSRGRCSRSRAVAVLGPLVLLLVLWLWLLCAIGAFRGGPNGGTFGTDFAMFSAAAQVTRDGGTPYDHNAVYRAEYRLLHRQGLAVTTSQYVRVANPPLFYWALRPLIGLPFQKAALVWAIAMYGLALLGFLATLLYFGWAIRVLPSVLFLAMPQVIFATYYGNADGLILAAVGCALLFERRHPVIAGVVLSLVWIKPPVGLPLVLLIVLLHSGHRTRVLSGFLGASTILTGLTVLATGARSLVLWVHALMGFSQASAQYYDVASLAGLYIGWAPGHVRLALEALAVAAASALTFLVWRRSDGKGEDFLRAAWLWPVWFLAAPFVHFHDEIVLMVPLLALLGRDAGHLDRWPGIVALYLLFFSLIPLSVHPSHAQMLWLPILGLVACCVAAWPTPAAKEQPAVHPSPALEDRAMVL